MKTRKYTINDMDYEVSVNSFAGDSAEVTVNGVTYQVKISEPEDGSTHVSTDSSVTVCDTADRTPAAKGAERTGTGTGRTVNSPLPGVIIGIKVKVGDTVKDGQVVAILEAMKMENEIQSEYSGTVTAINVSSGDSVLEGAPIVTIE